MAEEEVEVGKIKHYFGKLKVAVVELSGGLKKGDGIHVKGSTTDFKQKIKSMQVEHEEIETAESGTSIGLKVSKPVRENDTVYKIAKD